MYFLGSSVGGVLMPQNNPRTIVYVAPDANLIERFSREVCLHLGEHGDAGYNRPEVISGLSEYLKFASQLIAKCVNEGHYELLDN